MNNKTKNIISNIIGLAVIALGFYEYFTTKNMYMMLGLFVAGLSAFLFKVSETKNWLRKILNKGYSNGVPVSNTSAIGSEIPKEDDEEVDA